MARECQLGDVSSMSSRGFGVPSRNVAGVTAVQYPILEMPTKTLTTPQKFRECWGTTNNCAV